MLFENMPNVLVAIAVLVLAAKAGEERYKGGTRAATRYWNVSKLKKARARVEKVRDRAVGVVRKRFS